MKLSLLGYREQENSDCFIFTNSYTLLVLIILLDTTLLLEEHILILHSSLTWAFEKRTACDKCAASLKSDLDICNHLYGEEPLKIHSTLSTPSVLHLFILISLHTFLTKEHCTSPGYFVLAQRAFYFVFFLVGNLSRQIRLWKMSAVQPDGMLFSYCLQNFLPLFWFRARIAILLTHSWPLQLFSCPKKVSKKILFHSRERRVVCSPAEVIAERWQVFFVCSVSTFKTSGLSMLAGPPYMMLFLLTETNCPGTKFLKFWVGCLTEGRREIESFSAKHLAELLLFSKTPNNLALSLYLAWQIH